MSVSDYRLRNSKYPVLGDRHMIDMIYVWKALKYHCRVLKHGSFAATLLQNFSFALLQHVSGWFCILDCGLSQGTALYVLYFSNSLQFIMRICFMIYLLHVCFFCRLHLPTCSTLGLMWILVFLLSFTGCCDFHGCHDNSSGPHVIRPLVKPDKYGLKVFIQGRWSLLIKCYKIMATVRGFCRVPYRNVLRWRSVSPRDHSFNCHSGCVIMHGVGIDVTLKELQYWAYLNSQ